MAISEFNAALNQVATERGISVDSVLESVRMALATAYKKDRKEHDEDVEIEEITIDLDSSSGEVKILKDSVDVTPSGFGRIAAQTAKQVILQKIRETEKDVIKEEFESKVGTIVSGTVFRMENNIVTLDLGRNRTQGIMPSSEQVSNESYRLGQRLKVLVKDRDNSRGTEVVVSRSDSMFVSKLFEQEVPEISTGVVEIKAIAREAASRTKMAVSSNDDKVDPVGSCVGQKGVRVQSIISELFGEKIDIVSFSEIPEKFIAASLSPAKVNSVVLDQEEHRATVTVPEEQQSLAIGKEGQNARLSNKLTQWKIDIKGGENVFSSEDLLESEKKKSILDAKVVGVWDDAIRKVNEDSEKEEAAEEAAELAKNAAEDTTETPAEEEVAEEKSEE